MRGSVRLAALSGLHVIYVWTHDSVGPRRGRADAPAGRALRGAPGDPQPVVRAAGRRQRGGRGRVAARGRARRARARSRSRSRARSCRRSRARPSSPARACGAAATCCARPRRGGTAPRADPHRRPARSSSSRFAAAEPLEARGIPTRVVSLPCWERFEAQDAGVSRLGPAAGGQEARVGRDRASRSAGSAGSGDEGAIIGLDHFGASAPAGDDLQGARVHGRSASRTSAGGSCARASTAGRRRSARRMASHPTLGRATPASTAPRAPTRATTEHRDARRVRRRPRRGGVQGRADPAAGGGSAAGDELTDLGGDGSDPNDDYPDFAQRLARRSGTAARTAAS